MTADNPSVNVDAAVLAGQEIYSERVLRIYDPLVLGATNRFVWRCPCRHMRRLYERDVSATHLELGVGTGYFLDHCRFPSPNPELVLVDLNPDTLQFTSRRLARYQPKLHRANVLEPLDLPAGGFDSVAMNMLLHCLPGDSLLDKTPAVANAARAISQGGWVFGSTILAGGVRLTGPAKAMLRNHNERGILHNAGDTLADLRTVLATHFAKHNVWTKGNVALFDASEPYARPSEPESDA